MNLDGRRLVRALGLTVVLFLFVGGGVGFVVAAGENDALRVPAPRAGDRAEYTATERIVDRDALTLDPGYILLDHVIYEWLPERLVQDADFRMRPAWPLRAEFVFATGTNLENHEMREYLYDAGTFEPLFRSDEDGQSYCVGEGVNVALGSTCSGPVSRDVSETWIKDRYEGVMGPCGFLTPLHGRTYDGQPFVAPGACDWPGGQERVTYLPQASRKDDGVATQSFVAQHDDRLTLAYDGTSPFPSSATAILGDFFTYPRHTFGRVWDLQRIGVTQGNGPYTPQTPPSESSARIALAAATTLLLDDSGMDLPLPMDEAYALVLGQVALDPPGNLVGGVGQRNAADWLDDHPDAYLAFAMRLEFLDDQGQPQPSWTMVWADDSGDFLGKCVGLASDNAPGLPSTNAPASGYTVRDCYFDGMPLAPEDRRLYFPRSSMVPDRLPLPRELRDRYEALHPDQPVNRYGFQVFCREAPCQKAVVLTEVAHQVASQSASPVDPASSVRVENTFVDRLQVDAEGRTAWRTSYMGTEAGVLPLITPPASEATTPASSATAASVWTLPATPEAATGVSLLALLGGLLYYFWPALKGLAGAGLFSRIADDALLDNPTRRRIHDAIQAEPGIHFQALARRAGVGRGTLDHHLRKLEAGDLVTVRKSPGYTCYFPKGKLDRHMLEAAPSLRSKGSRTILEAVAAKPGSSSRDLAAHLGLAPSTVSYHLKRLETAGLVAPGNGAGVRVTDLGARAAS